MAHHRDLTSLDKYCPVGSRLKRLARSEKTLRAALRALLTDTKASPSGPQMTKGNNKAKIRHNCVSRHRQTPDRDRASTPKRSTRSAQPVTQPGKQITRAARNPSDKPTPPDSQSDSQEGTQPQTGRPSDNPTGPTIGLQPASQAQTRHPRLFGQNEAETQVRLLKDKMTRDKNRSGPAYTASANQNDRLETDKTSQ